MECNTTSNSLKLVEFKKETLRKSLEQVHAQASSAMLFTLQWKDIENHLDLAMEEVEKRSREVELHAKEVKVLVEMAKEMESKQDEFRELKEEIEKCGGELDSKEKRLDSVKNAFEKCSVELKSKEEELSVVRKSVDDYNMEIGLKKDELGRVEKSIQERNVEIQLKEKHAGLVKKWVEECTREFNLKEEQMKLMKESVEECSAKLGLKSKELIKVENSILDCSEKLESKEKELRKCEEQLNVKNEDLHSVKNAILECKKELVSNENKVCKVKKNLHDFHGELFEKKEQNVLMNKSLEEESMEFESLKSLVKERKRELEVLHNSIKSCGDDFEVKEKLLIGIQKLVDKRLEELEKKENEIASVKRLIKEYNEELEVQEKKYNEIETSTRKCSEELSSKEMGLVIVKQSIQKCGRNLNWKQTALESLEKRVVDCEEELVTKEKKLDSLKVSTETYQKELESRQKQIELMRMSIEDSRGELKVKEDQLSSIESSIADCSEQLVSQKKHAEMIESSTKEKSKELLSIERRMSESIKELEVKEKHFDSFQQSLEERSDKLATNEKKYEQKERQFDERVKELESEERTIESARKVVEDLNKEIELKQKQLNDSIAHKEKYKLEVSISKNGKDLMLFLTDILKKHVSVHTTISHALNASSDPAKLVLDAMHSIYPLHREDMEEIDVDVVRRSCILLLEEVMAISPPITRKVWEEAIKLACDWKSKMSATTENSLEVLVFLHVLAAYNLSSTFEAHELRNLMDIVVHHRHTRALVRAFGISDNATVSNILPQVKIEQQESFPESNTPSNTPDSISMTTLLNNMVVRSMPLYPKPHDLKQKEVSAALQLSSDPARFVLDVVERAMLKHWQKGGTEIESSLVNNFILLLEELVRISPHIKPEVKADAVKLGTEWNMKLKADANNSLEVLGFLQLVATYSLLSSFNRDAIFSLFKIVCQHKNAHSLCQDFGFSDKILEFSRDLIAEKQYTKAVRVLCSSRLVHDRNAASLLVQQMEHVKKSIFTILNNGKSFVADPDETNKAIASLKDVLGCIIDYKLETELPSQPIVELLAMLETNKIDQPMVEPQMHAGFVNPIDQPTSIPTTQNQVWTNHGTSAPTNQPNHGSDLAYTVQPQMSGQKNHIMGFPINQPMYHPVCLPQQPQGGSHHIATNATHGGHQMQQPNQSSGNKRPRVEMLDFGKPNCRSYN